eukprot:s507_g23.t1
MVVEFGGCSARQFLRPAAIVATQAAPYALGFRRIRGEAGVGLKWPPRRDCADKVQLSPLPTIRGDHGNQNTWFFLG